MDKSSKKADQDPKSIVVSNIRFTRKEIIELIQCDQASGNMTKRLWSHIIIVPVTSLQIGHPGRSLNNLL